MALKQSRQPNFYNTGMTALSTYLIMTTLDILERENYWKITIFQSTSEKISSNIAVKTKGLPTDGWSLVLPGALHHL